MPGATARLQVERDREGAGAWHSPFTGVEGGSLGFHGLTIY